MNESTGKAYEGRGIEQASARGEQLVPITAEGYRRIRHMRAQLANAKRADRARRRNATKKQRASRKANRR